MSAQQAGGRGRVIPVIDVMEGQVVRAVGGRRELYQPLRSKLIDSTAPLAVAEAALRAVGVNELYVADIDGLLGHRPRLGWIAEVAARGCRVMVDAGIHHAADAKAVFDAGATAVVAGTETIAGPDELRALVESVGPDRVVLSVDLRNGQVVGSESAWGVDPDPIELVRIATAVGIRRVIVLELARVGTGIGPGTVGLCHQMRAAFPDLELIAGGGVRDREDVDRLAEAGADGVLVASAIHDGHLGAAPS
jgi:phosphoribosylformimino-5-aminoimidazole carboxamide ribotide isomerase